MKKLLKQIKSTVIILSIRVKLFFFRKRSADTSESNLDLVLANKQYAQDNGLEYSTAQMYMDYYGVDKVPPTVTLFDLFALMMVVQTQSMESYDPNLI